jgi:hypothetical protein
VETRHLGKTEPGLQHCSFVIEGSKCIWFMGDAAPVQMKKMASFPAPDVLIVPYAYANTASAWAMTKEVCPGSVIVLHLPEENNDPYGLWRQVKDTIQEDPQAWLPCIGECRNI